MPDVTIDGCTVHYEEMGRGVPIVLTPGGRWGLYVQETVASALAQDFRVIIWDRPNTDGKSGIRIAGDCSEADLWSDVLAGLIRTLKLAPCYVGEYAGCRT
ncbi:MAG: alpha/beta fold hydrolase, partial [Stellaceae bacterium]